MNELSKETSPYLLQHAENPVDWKAWNDQTLALARDQSKLIIVSTGYSACHWCHVMEHESFEDHEVAATMNSNFICIKVDREERPDIDAIYMKAVQLMTGQGGWPMNVVCLPDGRPVWGGTYFRKNEWINSLQHLASLYKANPEQVIDYAEKVHDGINTMNLIPQQQSEQTLSQELLDPMVKKWEKSFDHEFGGYERAPKFMMPNNLEFLLRYGYQHQHISLLDHVNLTLTKMAYGGLFDVVGGGFSRYSVDMKWHVPHFEKMLYDNGQLVSLYSKAFRLTQNPLYREVIEKTLAFVERELANGEGGFFSALDADSLNESGKLEEGAFYVWTKAELKEILGDDYEIFAEMFNVNDFGYWEHDNYVLIRNQTIEEISKRWNVTTNDLYSRKKNWEQALFLAREKRSRPRLDDKSLTSWNAIMLDGYIEAYKSLNRREDLDAALKCGEFIINHCKSADGNLFHSYKAGRATINGYLEDYALTVKGFIGLYEITSDEKFLNDAKQLTDYSFEHFYDKTAGYFHFMSDLDSALISQHFEMEDNVIPASNSVMAENLFRLGIYFSNSYYEEICSQMVNRLIPLIDYPSAFANWLNVFLNFSDQNRELAVAGPEAENYIEKLNGYYLPNVIIAGSKTVSSLPFMEGRHSENETLMYVCINKTCGLPNSDIEEVLSGLKLK